MDLLIKNPRSGAPVGKNFYKVRLQIASKGKVAAQGLSAMLILLS
jgi:hypothetical protein